MHATTNAALAAIYVDAADRQRVRHRALILALLDACFEHSFPDSSAGGLEIDAGVEPDIWSELASSRRAFAHDVQLLDAGRRAQLILKPTKTDVAVTDAPTTAKMRELILWLAVIHLHQAGIVAKYPTQGSVIEAAAKATGRKPGSILTELSSYKTGNGTSDEHIAQFWDLVATTQALARDEGNEKRAFALLLPAALALSEAAVRDAATAFKEP